MPIGVALFIDAEFAITRKKVTRFAHLLHALNVSDVNGRTAGRTARTHNASSRLLLAKARKAIIQNIQGGLKMAPFLVRLNYAKY